MHENSPQYFYRKGHRNRFLTGRYSAIIAIIGLLCTGLVFTPTRLGLHSLVFSSVEASTSRDIDAIIVLGGGLTPDGSPPLWQQARCKLAAELYSKAVAAGQSPAPVVITLSGGTTWKAPPRDDRGFPITEAASSARYLATLGVPYEHLFEEGFSLDTIGNAYFLRAMHTDVAGWRRLEVITNDFHMPRTRAIFEWVFQLPSSAQSSSQPSGRPYELSFKTAPDDGMSTEVAAGRRAKEMKSLRNLPTTSNRVRTMHQLHSFIFEEHVAYASSRHSKMPEVLDPAVLSTY